MLPTEKFNHNSRLIVLIPETLAGNLELSRNVARYAKCRAREVVYLVVMEDLHSNLQVTRSMVTMKAMTTDRDLAVGYQLVYRTNLVKILKILVTEQGSAIIPRPSNELPGKFKFASVNISDWFSLTFALSFATNKDGAKLH